MKKKVKKILGALEGRKILTTESTNLDKPSLERGHSLGGIQKIWRFENGYGASVVRFGLPQSLISLAKGWKGGYGSYTDNEKEWELAVVKFKKDSDNFELCYNTAITDDVAGHLKKRNVEKMLKRIKGLK